jgi:hypothetical protein
VLLIKRHGPAAKLPALVARMRCLTCERAPVSAAMVDDITAGAHGTGIKKEPVRRPVRPGQDRSENILPINFYDL